MNRNTESHFSLLPRVDISRSRFDRSASVKTTFNTGDIVPFFLEEVLPGDTFNVKTSKVVRMQTLLTPLIGSVAGGSGMDTSRTKGSRFIDLRDNLGHGGVLVRNSFLGTGIDIGTLKGLGRAYKAS
jgi:hypothetical protein